MHCVENRLDDRFVPDSCVDHHVVEERVGQSASKLMFDEGDAFAVDGVDEILGLRFRASSCSRRRTFSARGA